MSPKDFTYDLPDGYEFKPEHRAKIDAVMEKLGADNETAQELINIHVEIVEDYANDLATMYGKEASSLETNYETEDQKGN